VTDTYAWAPNEEAAIEHPLADPRPGRAAVELFQQGRQAEAATVLRGAIRQSVELDLLNDLGVVLAALGEDEQGRSLLRACLAIDPTFDDARANLVDLDLMRPLPQVIAEAGPPLLDRLLQITDLTAAEIEHQLLRTGQPVDVPIAALDGATVRVRPGTSDVRVVDDTWDGAYHLPPAASGTPRLIVDLGSNIGLTLVDLATRYPEARLIGVELDADNIAVARANTARFGDRVRVVHAAIGAGPGVASYRVSEGTEYGFSVGDTGPGEERLVASLGLDDILAAYAPGETIDYLKVDVEGAERELFRAGGAWVERVRALKVELHPPYGVEQARVDLEALGFAVEPEGRHWSALIAVPAGRAGAAAA
jgi:FkbM family methyltransferase